MDILRINDASMHDESIESYESHEYEPVTGANLNNSGEIRINIETQDLFTHPSESYLIVEGRLTKDDGTTNKRRTINPNALLRATFLHNLYG